MLSRFAHHLTCRLANPKCVGTCQCYEYQLGATGHARLALSKMSTLQKALLKHRTKHVRLDLWCRFLGFCAADERYPNELFRAYGASLLAFTLRS